MTPSSTTTTPGSLPARFLLLGDSHAAVIGQAATTAGIGFQGGPIGSARDFTAGFFEVGPDDIVFHDAEANRRYRGFLTNLGVAGLHRLAVPLVCTFGFSAHVYATTENWSFYRTRAGDIVPGFLASALFTDVVRAMARGALRFYAHARGAGLRVLAVMPPQRVPGMSDPAVFDAAQDVVRNAVHALGVEVVDLRALVTDASGRQRPEFSPANDPIHGNLAFGRLILADLLTRGL
jgi:hypothetical protein